MLRKKKPPVNNRNLASPQSKAPVFSYYANRSSSEEGRKLNAKQATNQLGDKYWLATLPSVIATLAILACALYATSLSTQPRVQLNTSNSQHLLRDNEFYQQAASSLLASSILNRNKLTIDTVKVAQRLESDYPELGQVSVIIPLISRRPIIEAQPAKPIMRLRGAGGDFIVDEQGRALIKTDDTNSSLRGSLPVVVDESGLELTAGRQVMPLSTMKFIKELTAQLQIKQITIKNMSLPPVSNELHLRLQDRSYYVKLDIQGDPRQQAGALVAVYKKLSADNIVPLEYIDVRLPEKVFYK